MKPRLVAVTLVVLLAVAGCKDDENKRLAEMAERSLERQSAQEIRNAELHGQVAEGTKRLLEADSAARETIVQLHRDIQTERRTLGQQRDLLEAERRDIAATRNRDPIIAEAIKGGGLLLACLVPLLIALRIVWRTEEPDETAVITELLLSEFVGEQPTLLRLPGTGARPNTPASQSLADQTPQSTKGECNRVSHRYGED